LRTALHLRRFFIRLGTAPFEPMLRDALPDHGRDSGALIEQGLTAKARRETNIRRAMAGRCRSGLWSARERPRSDAVRCGLAEKFEAITRDVAFRNAEVCAVLHGGDCQRAAPTRGQGWVCSCTN
jgi:hypothetical protein